MLLQNGTIVNDVDDQWHNPADILSLLLILSPGIVHRAFAQLVGAPVAPVAFSFGWVAYSVNALLSVFGGMSIPDRDFFEESSLALICSHFNQRWRFDARA